MDSAHLVSNALELRRMVLEFLASSERESATFGGVSPEVWEFFLRFECCALPLAAWLRAAGVLRGLPEPTRLAIVAAESAEAQRVLAARQIVRELDAIGQSTGARLALLKGAAVAADRGRQPIDLGDVDVLVTAAMAARTWDTMRARGWAPVTAGFTPEVGLGDRIHYAPLRSPGHQLSVELHDRFAYGSTSRDGVGRLESFETRSIPGYRTIDRLVGVHGVIAVLRHSVIRHPRRRGHLRDIILLSQELQGLSADMLGEARRLIETDAYAPELERMFSQAVALATGTKGLADDAATRSFVAWKYASGAGTSSLFTTRFPGWADVTHIALERPAIRGSAYRREVGEAFESVPSDSSLARRAVSRSRLGRALQVTRLARMAYRVLRTIALAVCAERVRRHVQGLQRIPDRATRSTAAPGIPFA